MNTDPLHSHPIEYGNPIVNLFGSAVFRVLFFLSLVTAAVVGPATYWAFDNVMPYDFIADGSVVIPTEARGNDQMLVKWKVRFNRVCPGLIRRQLVDPHTGVVLAVYDPQPTLTDPPGFRTGYLNKTFLLPRNIQTGWIGYRSTLEIWCNPLQRVWPLRATTPTLLFKVNEAS
jgi:hypothetical protein